LKTILKDIFTKLHLKNLLLSIYFFFFNCGVYIRKQSKHFINPKRVSKQIKKGYLNIYLDSDWLGFGARFIKTLELLNYAKIHNVELNIEYGYKDKKKLKYFSRLFEPISERFFSNNKYIKIEDTNEIEKGTDLNVLLDLKSANQMLLETYVVCDSLKIELDEFIKANFKNERVLGVHYRGTDKEGEATRLQEEKLFVEIQKYLKNGYSKIFISTDEINILEKVKRRFYPLPVVYRHDAYRSSDGDQFHRKIENDKEVINHDALMNILILSKTDFLLKTASIMSDCCFIFNPDLQYKILSTPHSSNLTWWPATELLNKNEN
jgi:hypothetical protein